MVTARQIQQLTRQRLEGTVPSYPEQWLEGPMVRRERRIMNRGGILYGRRAKTLPRLKPGGSAEAPAFTQRTGAGANPFDGIDVGCGLFATAPLPRGAYLCEYTGVVQCDRRPMKCFVTSEVCVCS